MAESTSGDSFTLENIRASRTESGRAYLEFLRVPALSCGLYVLPAGAEDTQKPHTEDEVYIVMKGRAMFRANGEESEVSAGSILYVPANVDHRFHSIAEEFEVLVLFAPAEYSNKP